MSTTSDLTLFADDSNLVCVSPPNTTLDVHRKRLQSDVNSCMEWSRAAEAQFHTDKCVHLPFRKSSVAAGHARLNVEMGGQILSQPNTHHHLGIILTPSLDMSFHVRAITNKFRNRIFFLCYMSSLLPFPTIHILYKCYVRPLLEYAILIWMFSLSIPLSGWITGYRCESLPCQ